MTNRMVLWDAQLGSYPPNQRAWAGFQRQLAEDTAPGFISRVLLTDQAFDSTTPTEITGLVLSLKANIRYWYEYTGMYNRTDTDDFDTIFARSAGLNAPTTGDKALMTYFNGSNTVDQSFDPFTAMTFSSDGTDRVFQVRGWFSCTSAGTLTVQGYQSANNGVNDVTVYAGTRIVFQPILNLSDRSNP